MCFRISASRGFLNVHLCSMKILSFGVPLKEVRMQTKCCRYLNIHNLHTYDLFLKLKTIFNGLIDK